MSMALPAQSPHIDVLEICWHRIVRAIYNHVGEITTPSSVRSHSWYIEACLNPFQDAKLLLLGQFSELVKVDICLVSVSFGNCTIESAQLLNPVRHFNF